VRHGDWVLKWSATVIQATARIDAGSGQAFFASSAAREGTVSANMAVTVSALNLQPKT